MPWTSVTTRPETAERLNKQAARFGRSRSDLIEALSLLAEESPDDTARLLMRVQQLQPTRGTGRRAVAKKKNQKSTDV